MNFKSVLEYLLAETGGVDANDSPADKVVEPDPPRPAPVSEYRPARLSGRCRTGSDQSGRVIHAVFSDGHWGDWLNPALCGKRPGRLSVGWIETDEGLDAVTCPACRKKLKQGGNNNA
ncbi:MAG: hypothetical protein HPY85_10685 [Anaerolineae bacterium]|nr:hypothetical protein [Anaerolineae bacterium]